MPERGGCVVSCRLPWCGALLGRVPRWCPVTSDLRRWSCQAKEANVERISWAEGRKREPHREGTMPRTVDISLERPPEFRSAHTYKEITQGWERTTSKEWKDQSSVLIIESQARIPLFSDHSYLKLRVSFYSSQPVWKTSSFTEHWADDYSDRLASVVGKLVRLTEPWTKCCSALPNEA